MDELPKRKGNRLPGFDYGSPGAYFVTICTEKRQRILSEIIVGADALGGPKVVLTHTGRIVEKYILSTNSIPRVRVDKYMIMPDHVHLLMTVEENDGPPRASAPTTASVSNAVSALKRLVNRELGTNIWQRSFYDHVIRNERDYMEISQYIENNPARWAEKTDWLDGGASGTPPLTVNT